MAITHTDKKQKIMSDIEKQSISSKTMSKLRLNGFTKNSSSTAQIWRSKLSWKIAFVVFLTIMIVQLSVLFLTMKQEKITLLNDIREIGRSALAANLETGMGMLESPLSKEKANRLLASTLIDGVSIYSADLLFLGSYGTPVSLPITNANNFRKTYFSMDGNSYEVILSPSDLYKPYVAVVRLNSENVAVSIKQYVQQSLIIMLLLSALVTTVLMIALGRWLLEPILFMRKNLLAAQRNPDNPIICESPYNDNDEIGEAIMISQGLILKNAEFCGYYFGLRPL